MTQQHHQRPLLSICLTAFCRLFIGLATMSFRFSSFSRVSPERLGRALASCEKNLVEPEVPPGMVVKNLKTIQRREAWYSILFWCLAYTMRHHETSSGIMKRKNTCEITNLEKCCLRFYSRCLFGLRVDPVQANIPCMYSPLKRSWEWDASNRTKRCFQQSF